MSTIAEGRAPKESSKREKEYLLRKLEEVRKDCQWLLGLAAASVLGVVLKDSFGVAMPRLRAVTLTVSASQILISMIGAMSWLTTSVDPSEDVAFLTRRLRARHWLRNLAVLLLSVSFILIAFMGWNAFPRSGTPNSSIEQTKPAASRPVRRSSP